MILKIIIFIFLFFYLIGILFKGIIRFFFGRMTDSFRQQQGGQQQYYTHRREGEVSIDYIGEKNTKGKKNNDGEYVDYIEVKD